MISCTASSLTTAAECFVCLSEKQLRAVRIYLKCAQLNGTAPACDPKTLVNAATAAGYLNLSVKQQMAVETYLDCQLTSSGGGCGFSGTGSPEGVVTASPGATYLNSSTDTFWAKKSGTGNTGWIELIA